MDLYPVHVVRLEQRRGHELRRVHRHAQLARLRGRRRRRCRRRRLSVDLRGLGRRRHGGRRAKRPHTGGVLGRELAHFGYKRVHFGFLGLVNLRDELEGSALQLDALDCVSVARHRLLNGFHVARVECGEQIVVC